MMVLLLSQLNTVHCYNIRSFNVHFFFNFYFRLCNNYEHPNRIAATFAAPTLMPFHSFAQNDFACGTETLARLRSTAIRASLQTDNRFARPHLLLAKLAPVLFGRSRSKERSTPLRMTVRLSMAKRDAINYATYEQWLFILTARATAKIVCVTSAMFFKSHKSVVWNRSTSATPYLMHAFWNLHGER